MAGDKRDRLGLSSEERLQGRRNFMKAMAVLPPAAALTAGALANGPVRAAIIGVGDEGFNLLKNCAPDHIRIQAICDIFPPALERALKYVEGKARGYPTADAKKEPLGPLMEMLEKEKAQGLEAVIIATPLHIHSAMAIACLEAGLHVLCEKTMAHTRQACQEMLDAQAKSGKVMAIGHQRRANLDYRNALRAVTEEGLLGKVYTMRCLWHRNTTWRRDPNNQFYSAGKGFDPRPYGYPDLEHLLDWRMFHTTGGGLMAELASHQIDIANWVFGTEVRRVHAVGDILQYTDDPGREPDKYRHQREVEDHVYAIYEYPEGRTMTFSSVMSNKFDHYYEQIIGEKGTLIFDHETEILLFKEGAEKAAELEAKKTGGGIAMETSASLAAVAGEGLGGGVKRKPYDEEIRQFVRAIRNGAKVYCDGAEAMRTSIAVHSSNSVMAENRRKDKSGVQPVA